MDEPVAVDLCGAVQHGDVVGVAKAIELGADVDAGEFQGAACVPMILAAMGGHAQCLRLLMDAGAVIDAEGSRGETAAMWSASKGDRDCLAALIAAGADVNARDWQGMTVAMWAARHGADKASCLNMLVQAGADLRPADSMRRTAATHAKIAGYPAMASFIKAQIATLDERKKIAKALRENSAMRPHVAERAFRAQPAARL